MNYVYIIFPYITSWGLFTKSSMPTVVINIGDAIAVVEGVDGASSDSGLFKFGVIAAIGVGVNATPSETPFVSSDSILLSRFTRSFVFTSIEDIAPTVTNDDVEAPSSSSGVMGLQKVIRFLVLKS